MMVADLTKRVEAGSVRIQRNDKSALPAVHGMAGSEGFVDLRIDGRDQPSLRARSIMPDLG